MRYNRVEVSFIEGKYICLIKSFPINLRIFFFETLFIHFFQLQSIHLDFKAFKAFSEEAHLLVQSKNVFL